MSINKAMVSGNLTRDAELRTTNGGTTILSLSVAVNERRKNSDGSWGDYPNYIDCIMFGSRAEKLSQYLTKGTKVAIEGRLHQNRWQDREGKNRSKVEITIDEIELMGSKPKPKQEQEQYFYDDEIPF